MSDALQLVGFTMGAETFGMDIGLVQEIVRMPQITSIPRSPEFVEGIVNLRGKIIPVVDLRKRFGLPATEATKSTRIIVATIAGRTVGLIVDAVSEVLRLDASSVEPTPEVATRTLDDSCLKGIAKLDGRLLILLDLDRILHLEQIQALARVA